MAKGVSRVLIQLVICNGSKRNPSRALRKPRQPSPRRTPGELFNKLVRLQARLRAPDGCPWDREQTPQTLRTFLIEETYEVLDALESGASDELAGELGDLLLQIIFHCFDGQRSRPVRH